MVQGMMQERENEFREQFRRYSNAILAEQTYIFERLLQTEEVNECLLVDDIIATYELLRDECVRRICMLAETEN